ncbi:hypothetical protein WMF31_08375 [Sorangium sp. So ce1036]|uniref:hypothetical protein n=1 Tax=Sorangium sp. So ce1036 TaxID=3133328 RepID=UPI003F0C471B
MGSDRDEHRQGWRLLRLASGEDKPLEHLFVEVANGGVLEGAERLRLLQDVDAFENTWFPRARVIIRRIVPRARREAFEAAFFKVSVHCPDRLSRSHLPENVRSLA